MWCPVVTKGSGGVGFRGAFFATGKTGKSVFFISAVVLGFAMLYPTYRPVKLVLLFSAAGVGFRGAFTQQAYRQKCFFYCQR